MWQCPVAIVLVGIMVGSNSSAIAQGQPRYDVMRVPESFLKADEGKFEAGMTKEEREALQAAVTLKRTLEMQVTNILRGSPPNALANDPEAQRVFDGWYSQYYFAILTHPGHLSEWPERRQKFLKMMAATMPADVHVHLVKLTRDTMLTIVKGNYHPVARYNAMLFIGLLNSTEASLIGKKGAPVPYVQGLVDALAEFEDPKQIDAVRVAALVTILRHVEIDRQLPDGTRVLAGGRGEGRIIDLMLTLVNAKTAPKGRTRGGHDWMRHRAIEILGALGSVGEGGKAASALQTVLADNETPVSIRCCAAEALGRLNYPVNATFKVADIAKNMGEVAAHSCYDEIRRVEAQQEREQTDDASGGGSTMGMYGGPATGAFGRPSLAGGNAPDPLAYRIALTRRRVKHRALLVKKGLVGEEKEKSARFTALSASAPGEEQATPPEEKKSGILALAKSKEDQDYVQKVAKHADFIIDLADDASFKDLTSLVAEIRKKVQNLEQDCGIVVNVDEMEVEAKEAEGLLENPLDNLGSGLGEIPSAKPAAKPPEAPMGKTPPKTPSEPLGKTPVPPGPVAPPGKTPVAPPKKTAPKQP